MRIIQVTDALDFGDGVSNDVINSYELLKEMGYETAIYSKWVHEKVAHYSTSIEKLRIRPDDILLHHFYSKSHVMGNVLKGDCFRVLVYHNITPPSFWGKSSQEQDPGEEQLMQNKDRYDFFLGDSWFNLECLQALGIKKPMDTLPIMMDFEKIDRVQRQELRDNPQQKIFLFVGRVAPNKRHEDIIDIFESYYKEIDCNSKLFFVGNYENYMPYYSALKGKLSLLACRDAVVFAGKVNDEDLYNYYKNADIFICMSEHEGFCIPLLESMYCGIPTVAYDACAVASTMGGAGVLVKDKQPQLLARLVHMVMTDAQVRRQIIRRQNERLDEFSKQSMKKKLRSLIAGWTGNEEDIDMDTLFTVNTIMKKLERHYQGIAVSDTGSDGPALSLEEGASALPSQDNDAFGRYARFIQADLEIASRSANCELPENTRMKGLKKFVRRIMNVYTSMQISFNCQLLELLRRIGHALAASGKTMDDFQRTLSSQKEQITRLQDDMQACQKLLAEQQKTIARQEQALAKLASQQNRE